MTSDEQQQIFDYSHCIIIQMSARWAVCGDCYAAIPSVQMGGTHAFDGHNEWHKRVITT